MDIKIISAGVDTLIIGFMIDSYRDVVDFEVLKEAKQKAGEKMFNKIGYPVTWFGTDFIIKASGGSGYEWIIRNDDVMVRIAKEARSGNVFPEIYVTFFSQFLWTEGMDGVMSKFIEWLNKWVVIRGTKVSRFDPCIDLAMPFPEIDIKNEMVTRARNKTEFTVPINQYVSGRRDIGYQIGSGDLLARIYDKTYEVVVSQKEWFRDYWIHKEWDGEIPVVRSEFQCRRDFLKDMGVDTYEDMKERMADIWRYCTNKWLKICYPGTITNQSRWKVKEFWEVIQDGFSLFGQAWGVLPYKVKKVQYEHLIKQARGVMASACAVKASRDGINTAMFTTRREIHGIIMSEDFRNDIIARIPLVGNMEKPDTHLVDEAVKLGAELIDVEFKDE